MPQDSLRSTVCRSFVTCDDPAGIVDCKTKRKSKSAKKIGGKLENAKSEKNLVTSSKDSIDKLNGSSSVQLNEVSKGAQKLSKIVDSLSKNNLEKKSEDIAKDLLKGAVSLQESLKMLGRLQEASKFMTSFKKKEKSGDRKSLGRSFSERFTDHSNVVEFQKPRLSADGSSKDCYDELREVIRESFARQNLLPKGSTEGREFAESKVDSSIGTATASNSQSSMFNSHDYISSDSSSSIVQSEKPKGSNLIAKLMGLDELASKPVQSSPKLLLEKSSNSTNKRPILDLDLPIARKPSFIVCKPKPDQRTLGEIVEIMQSKGLMRDKSLDEPMQKLYSYEVAEFSDDSPPIVLIKPLHSSSLDKEFPYENNCTCGRASSDTKELLKLWRMREIVSSKNIDPLEALYNSTMQRKSIADKHAVTRMSREKATKSFGEASTKSKDKERVMQDHRPPFRPKPSNHVTSHLQKGEVIEKRVVKIHREAPKMKKSEEINQSEKSNSGRATVLRANDQGSINSNVMNNSSREYIASNNQVPNQKSTISKTRTTKTVPCYAKQRKSTKSDKLTDKKIPLAVENIGNDTIDIEINPKLENEGERMERRIIPEHMSSKEGRDAPDISSRDGSKASSESTEIIIQQHLYPMCAQSDNSEVGYITSENASHKSQTTVTSVLLSSTTFLDQAEDLFDTTLDQSVMFEATGLDDDGLLDAKLILACASELLECKCQQWEIFVYPLLQHPKKRPKLSVPFEHLVARICIEIEKFKDNDRLKGDDLLIDYLYAKLKKDIGCNGGVAGAWDLGWINAFSWNEVEQVVVDIEEHLLGVIVEDLLSDFLLL
ncbi:hypothetical protein LIER_00834 [Lithospermum erythrorhizon]|uniref:DUF4378 domain-containing protein n=1 Tax=Lithospermum erythrorhizon TaxID=34254 RepID=A0AAV3NMF6_LITER